MPRPQKCRRVCRAPGCVRFGPLESWHSQAQAVRMTVDEYETIRLIDLERMTQQACSEQMQVARTTVQAIYDSARAKLADCLVNGKRLHIEGGNVRFCTGAGPSCHGRPCPHTRCAQARQQENPPKEEDGP